MIFVIVSTIDNKESVTIVNDEQKLKEFIIKFEGIGKSKSIDIYEGEQIDYNFTLEDKQETRTIKVPKVDIVR